MTPSQPIATQKPININISSLETPQPTSDYNTQVLEPLHKAQAEEAAEKAKQTELAKEAAQRQLERTSEVQSVPVSEPANTVQSIIVKWANAYGVSPAWMLRVANCESGFSTTVVNHHYSPPGTAEHPTGLFQFLPSTFEANAIRAGLVDANILSADDSAHVAAYMFSIGQSIQWECK